MKKTIGLCMIVKNESHVIERCLDSVKPLIDFAVICDTGSTDHTEGLIGIWLAQNKIPGSVYHHDWIDFATNRSQSLQEMQCKKNIDYVLVMDADDVLHLPKDFDVSAFKDSLTADAYMVPIKTGNLAYSRAQLFRNDKPFYYRGVVHEFLDCREPFTKADLNIQGFCIQPIQDGARCQSGDKFVKDAELLKQSLKTETDPFMRSRYTFYLANTLRDLGDNWEASGYYQKRAEMGGWVEEVYYSLWQKAVIEPTIDNFMKAHEVCPHRDEALHGAAKAARLLNQYQHAYILSKHGLTIPQPASALFSEPWIYQWGMLDEFSISAYYCGQYQESMVACQRLLNEGHLPIHEYVRVQQNLAFAIAKIDQ